MDFRVGQGIDIHRLAAGRDLVLGGVKIPSSFGLDGHSDADVLLHSLIDACLGAAGLSDLGHYFPNTEERWKGASSLDLLLFAWKEINALGWQLGNADIFLLAEQPKISPYIPEMKRNISSCLTCQTEQIGIKVSTAENLGFVGRSEGMYASTVVLLKR